MLLCEWKVKKEIALVFSQIEDTPIPIDSATWSGSYDKKRSILRISDNLMITKVLFSYGTDSHSESKLGIDPDSNRK